ncbi:MAG: hypothetical protein RBR16_14070 [Syntrophus sp. (in: bacteria)]|nr:hypothetical protein [Syntrophus sp. (in: bacteria)]
MVNLNPLFDKEVEMAMRRTIDAIVSDMLDLYEDGIVPKEDAQEMVLDADRIFMYGQMEPAVVDYYRKMPYERIVELAKKAIPLDLC